jgi:dTDP-4-dehydrorhamnose reductase
MAVSDKDASQQKKILVTGANGQLGKELKRLEVSYPGYEFIFLSREDLPIHHFEMIRYYFSVYKPHYVINCAAYTAVDRAEEEQERAFHINGEAVGVLAAVCKENNARLIHLSTDYVFNGMATTPYREDAHTHPQSVYGASKLEGEKQALQLNPDTIIIRTSWLYSEYGKNFVKTIIKLLQEKEEINVVNDQTGSPTYAADLAEAILVIIESGKWVPGIYHFSNEGVITWYDFATEIKKWLNSDCTIHPVPTSAYPTAARRPTYSALDKQKIQRVYGIALKDWKKSLAACMPRINAAGK